MHVSSLDLAFHILLLYLLGLVAHFLTDISLGKGKAKAEGEPSRGRSLVV